jgi:hypothetical protein
MFLDWLEASLDKIQVGAAAEHDLRLVRQHVLWGILCELLACFGCPVGMICSMPPVELEYYGQVQMCIDLLTLYGVI